MTSKFGYIPGDIKRKNVVCANCMLCYDCANWEAMSFDDLRELEYRAEDCACFISEENLDIACSGDYIDMFKPIRHIIKNTLEEE